jgi:hypothetical protein
MKYTVAMAKTGAPSEYSTIEETISPVALEKISSWILKLANASQRINAVSF